MRRSPGSISAALRQLAASQAGYFTAKQARQAGYADSTHAYHVACGHWEKAYRGIYRLADVETDPWGDLVVYSLWSMSRSGVPQGVFCRETALAVHGLIEPCMCVLHMTVPGKFRRNAAIPEKLRIYKEDIYPRDIVKMDGFSITTLEKTIADLHASTNPKIVEALKRAMSGSGSEVEVTPLKKLDTNRAPPAGDLDLMEEEVPLGLPPSWAVGSWDATNSFQEALANGWD